MQLLLHGSAMAAGGCGSLYKVVVEAGRVRDPPLALKVLDEGAASLTGGLPPPCPPLPWCRGGGTPGTQTPLCTPRAPGCHHFTQVLFFARGRGWLVVVVVGSRRGPKSARVAVVVGPAQTPIVFAGTQAASGAWCPCATWRCPMSARWTGRCQRWRCCMRF
jgi:hypothetical protein